MSKSYIDEGTGCVCSYMTSSSPKTMVAVDSGLKVFHKTPGKRLLRFVDVKVKEDFVCKKPFATMLGFAGFLIGFGAGFAALGGAAAMAALMGPVGWAILAVAIIAIALAAAFSKTDNKCSSTLSSVKWTNPHTKVRLKGKFAIHQASILTCPEGGTIRAIPDPVMAAKAASDIAGDSYKGIGLKALSQTVYGFMAGAFSARTGGLGTNAAGASTLNFGALSSTLAFGGIGYYVGEITDTHGGAATGTGLAVTVQPFVDEFADGATMGNLGSRFNAWWAFRPGLSEMPIVAFFKGLRPGNVILRTRAWYRFNPNFAKGLGLGLLTYLNDVILVDPQIERWEDKSADIATQSSKNSKSASILTNSF